MGKKEPGDDEVVHLDDSNEIQTIKQNTAIIENKDGK